MVGIVFVSHSKLLAEGVKELAEQMTQGKVSIEAAGGIDDEENPIGTDAMRVMAAIEKVYDNNNVLVLMDMGSALMSAEMAIQFLDEEIQKHIYLCAAPLVEGGIAAAVQAMIGADIKAVMEEASSAIKSKQKQLNLEEDETSEERENNTKNKCEENKEFINFEITVPNKFGLHARPASKLIELTKDLLIDIQISINSSQWFNAKSLNNLSLLGAKQGDQLYFKISGNDSQILKERIQNFANNNFGDKDEENIQKVAKSDISPSNKKGIWGIPSSNGIATGKAIFLEKKKISIPKEKTADAIKETKKFENALKMAKDEILLNKKENENSLSKDEMAIFDAHINFIDDFELTDKVKNQISKESATSITAWYNITQDIANQYKNSKNSYTREREADVRDIQELVLKHLGLKTETNYNFSEPTILLAKNLQPSETLKLDTKYVKGFILEDGNENAHTAIMARSLGIPAITGVGHIFSKIPLNQEILINGESGEILTDPNSKEWLVALKTQKEQDSLASEEKKFSQNKVKTKEGIYVAVNANISGVTDALLAQEYGADGIGLFRTELYFMNQDKLPTEDQQVELYTQICRILKGKSITIRTLDVGGDKPISYLPIAKEENPFLGLRGIRFLLANKAVFKTQIRAILRVSKEQNVRMMFPMISKIEEWKEAVDLVSTCKKELEKEGLSFNPNMPCGMMVEVPSVLMCIDQFAKEVDFFSIGTNDLSQYLMAADRGNSAVSNLITTKEEAVLKAIEIIGNSAYKFKTPVSICGELGSKEEVIPYLLKHNIVSLSMNALQVPKIKKIIHNLDRTII